MKALRKLLILLFSLVVFYSSVMAKKVVVHFVGGDVPDTLQTIITRNVNTFISTISSSSNNRIYPKEIVDNPNVYKFMQSNSIICEDIDDVYVCRVKKNGYEIRNLYVKVVQGDSIDAERKLTIDISSKGIIENVLFSIDDILYSNVFVKDTAPSMLNTDSISIEDCSTFEDKTAVVNLIEMYQTSFENKDMVFIEKLFSEDALIITGANVIRYNSNNVYQGDSKIYYQKQSKADYLQLIKRDMHRNEKTKIHISDIEIVKHPSNKQIYGVTIVQQYKSGNHSDNSKLFLLVDASTENLKILKRVFLPKERSIDIRDFHIK